MKTTITLFWLSVQTISFVLTLSHLGDLIHSRPGGGGGICNFGFLDPNETKFGMEIVCHKKKTNWRFQKLDKRWRHNDVICIFCKRYIDNIPSRHFDVRMTSYKNFIVDFGFRIQKYPLHQIWARWSQYPGKYASFFTFLFHDTFITKGCHGNTGD